MAPEFPFLAATAVALATGFRQEGKFPANGIKACIAAAVLVIFASATANTKAAPLVRAFGVALLIAAGMGFGRALRKTPARRVSSATAEGETSTGGGASSNVAASPSGNKIANKVTNYAPVATTGAGRKPVAPSTTRGRTSGGTF